jgi:hypothetical protein
MPYWLNVYLLRICTNPYALTDVSKEVVLEENTEKSKYMLMSRHQNSGRKL